jgi:hypothetical protein
MAKTDLTKGLLSRFDRLQGQRENWETHWQEVADYMQPRKADVTKRRARGDKRMEQVFDSSPIQAVELLAASLHGMLTNPSTPWFTLKFKDEEINNQDEAKLWLEASTDAMYTAFNRSNFQQEIFELYHDLITFGTAAMFIEEDDNDIIKFSTRHINEVFIAENDKGRIDTIYRKFKISARAAIQKFGDAVSADVQTKAKKDPYEEIELLHAVYPRSDFNPNKKDKSNMPFESVYMEFKNGNELSVGGFREFPFVVPRYLKASNEIYGRSPAMTALPDVKMLNEMSKTTIKAAQKQVDPPLLVPDDGFLMMQQGPQMTATEVIQRNEEKMRLLGPVLGRLQSELLKPLIDRVFAILFRNNMLPVAPQFLSGRDVEIEYVSPLAKAQKSTELQSIMRAVEILGSLANVAPVFDYVNFDNLVKHLADIVGVPQKILKSQKEVNNERQAQAQQQEQMQSMQQLQQVAKAGGDIAPLAKALPEEARAVANADVE